MNIYFLTAGILCFILGLVHSFLGEYLIFRSKRSKGKLVPTIVDKELKERHLRILWATWHLASFFGWCIGLFLIKLALYQNKLDTEFIDCVILSITCTMFGSSFLVLIGTKAKHPGWIVLLIIAILLIIGN